MLTRDLFAVANLIVIYYLTPCRSENYCCRSGLRSTNTSTSGCWKPRLRTKFAEFSFSGHAEWNCLPNDLRM